MNENAAAGAAAFFVGELAARSTISKKDGQDRDLLLAKEVSADGCGQEIFAGGWNREAFPANLGF